MVWGCKLGWGILGWWVGRFTGVNPRADLKIGHYMEKAPRGAGSLLKSWRWVRIYTLKELPQPQVDLTLGLLNLKPAPSMVSM